MNYLKSKWLLPFLMGLFFMASCDNNPETARLVIKLVDQPGDYKQVNVDIQGVAIHTNGDAEETDAGWTELAGGNVGVKDLLEFTGGTELTLAETDFPAGKISQIRLMLGENNSVDIDKNYPLKTPSGQQSGLKLQVHEDLVAGITYEFTLDFDAAQSVVHTGAETYILKPVVRVITKAKGGAIKGEVFPAEPNVAITVMDGTTEIASTYAPVDKSAFLLSGIEEGTYNLKFEPETQESGTESPVYEAQILENVQVVTGQVTELIEPVQLNLVE